MSIKKHLTPNIVKTFAALSILGVLLLSYSYFIEPHRLVITEYQVEIKGWDPAFNGLRIAAISDIHGGSNGIDEEKLKKIVEVTNAQSPDLIVLLGDYVSQTIGRDSLGRRNLHMPVSKIVEGLKGFQSKYGVFVVMGNHDDWYGNREVVNAFQSAGYTVLDGAVSEISMRGQTLRVLGLKDHLTIKDWKSYSSDARALLQPTDGKGSVLILQHGPDVLPIITGELSITSDPAVMLSGHTHGGQIWLPVLGSPIIPSSYGQKYAAGHVRDNGLDIFITTGVGTSLLPFRFMVPPEIALLTVRSAE